MSSRPSCPPPSCCPSTWPSRPWPAGHSLISPRQCGHVLLCALQSSQHPEQYPIYIYIYIYYIDNGNNNANNNAFRTEQKSGRNTCFVNTYNYAHREDMVVQCQWMHPYRCCIHLDHMNQPSFLLLLTVAHQILRL